MCAQPLNHPAGDDRDPLIREEADRQEALAKKHELEARRERDLTAGEDTKEELRNEDPLTGEPGSHPVATGAGAAIGGAAAGAAAGMLGGPVGTTVGAIVGGVAGGLAGKAIGEQVDPTVEDTYWREEFRNREYVSEGEDYETFQPAYQYGWESRQDLADRGWDEVEPQLERNWPQRQGNSNLTWDRARHATRDAWVRIDEEYPRQEGSDSPRPNPR